MTSLTLTLPDVEFTAAGGMTMLTLGPASVDALADALACRLAPQEASPFMTIAEAGEYLRVPRHRIDALLSQRKLSRQKEGRRTLIRRSDLDAYLAAQ
jgi:excisionase family DNA binding protein